MTPEELIKQGGPAFPTDNEGQTGPNTWHFSGMTKRELFAALSLMGQRARDIAGNTPECAAQVADADALLDALEAKKPDDGEKVREKALKEAAEIVRNYGDENAVYYEARRHVIEKILALLKKDEGRVGL